MVTPARDLVGNGTPTRRDVGVGDWDSSFLICISISGIDITKRGLVLKSSRDERDERLGLTNVLWLNVGVNEITLIMEILESQKDLFRHRLDKCSGNALLLVPLNQSKQIFTQRLENDADVGRFRTLMLERVQE